MAEFKLGRLKFVWKGDWATGAAYVKDDIVSYGGKSYVCVQGHTAAANFYNDNDATYWELMNDGTQWKGDWETSTWYKEGDIVSHGGKTYIAVDGHQSGAGLPSFYIALNAGDWQLYSDGFQWKNSWITGTWYKVNDVVNYGGKSYVANVGHSAAADFYTDESKWDLLNDGFKWRDVWSATTKYNLNDVVRFGGGLYLCSTQHTSGVAFDETKWDVFVEGYEFENSWSNATEYQAGDVVAYGGYTYIALRRNTAVVPTSSLDDWKPFLEGMNYLGPWLFDYAYRTGDVVSYGGYTYICKVDVTAALESPEDGNFWTLFSEGLSWKGEWTSGVRYKKGELVKQATNTYICITHHDATSLNSPLEDTTNQYWNTLADGAELIVLTTRGDMIIRDATGHARLPIGELDQILAVNQFGEPAWSSTANIKAHSLTTTDNIEIDPTGVNGGILGVGVGAVTLTQDDPQNNYVGLTDVSGVMVNDVDAFAQFALKNRSSGLYASTDLIAYTDNGDNDSGWIDMGITSSNFDITSGYGITGKHDGYIFMSAPAGTTGTGNLVIATNENGTERDIVFVTGGFDPTINTDAEKVRIIGEGRPGKPAGMEIYINTESTSTDTGALRVQGGIGLQGNLNALGDIQMSGGAFYQGKRDDGVTAKDLTVDDTLFSGYVGLTNTSGIFTGDADDFVQFALKNHNAGASASTDIIAYASDGDNDSGWIDMGITSENYNDPTFSVTGPGTGYIFYSAPVATAGTGDLLIGTDANGSNADIIFFTNGFDAGNERMAIIGVDRPGKQAGVEIYSVNDSTSTTTGALRVQGGIGLQGNMNVGGNVNIVGTITVGGSGSALQTQTLAVSDPMIRMGTGNSTDSIDLGFFGTYSGITTTLNGSLTSSATTIPVVNAAVFPVDGGTVIIDEEQITYTAISGGNLTGCVRGANGSTASAHATSSTIYYPKYTGLVRDASDNGKFKLFAGLNTATPSTTVDTTATTWAWADLQVGVLNATSIQNTPIGSSTRASGAFTTLAANSTVTLGGITTVSDSTASTSTTTGALVVAGGVGIGGKLNVNATEGIKIGSYTMVYNSTTNTLDFNYTA